MPRQVVLVLGILVVVLGVALMFTPVPGSTFILSAGMAMVLCTSPYTARCLQLLRLRFSLFDRLVGWAETHTGKLIGEALSRTRPDHAPD